MYCNPAQSHSVARNLWIFSSASAARPAQGAVVGHSIINFGCHLAGTNSQDSLKSIEIYWNLLKSIEIYWNILKSIEIYWIWIPWISNFQLLFEFPTPQTPNSVAFSFRCLPKRLHPKMPEPLIGFCHEKLALHPMLQTHGKKKQWPTPPFYNGVDSPTATNHCLSFTLSRRWSILRSCSWKQDMCSMSLCVSIKYNKMYSNITPPIFHA